MVKLIQYYSKSVSLDHIHMFLMDRDCEDSIQVLCKDDTCYEFIGQDMSEDHLHTILDHLCDYIDYISEAA
jgi:hypothetical protein